jgi:hypothetical protein
VIVDRDVKPENVISLEAARQRRWLRDARRRRARRGLRLVPKPLAYCRPENDQGRR